ncbi:MAG: thioredoxin domain-containing protein [Burkholderiales bacterium]|nr:thioredoxin domain-containing protein [Burkholderiales bacterium]
MGHVEDATHRNRLAAETSPYLQQHAANPVDWYPWGEEAFRVAREQDKPVLLSVGYSACHWCHVMAHESFEDPAVARVMNELFVNVKVDREERPDVDQIYQAAHQLFNQGAGGWPLTAFLTPDQMPFFVGTYFPKTARYGRPGFVDLLRRIAEVYRESRADIARQNEAVREALARMRPAEAPPREAFSRAPLADAVTALARAFDDVHGGFGGAPKFPHATDLELLLREHAREGTAEPLRMAVLTLERMAEGGLYDQLGGGFARYSVDERWLIPHFEKMLYDNGPLLALYADAWRATREALFARVAEETAGWAMREMQSPEGGYYSSLDADSEGEEGKFYVWTRAGVQSVLTRDEYAVAAPHFGLDGAANFEGEHWHLHVAKPLAEVAAGLGIAPEEASRRLASARAKLFAERERRIRPGRDEKVLASWNALMARGMLRAGTAFGRRDWIESARRALAFLRGTLWKGGRLFATYKDGRAHLNAYLDDYAFLLDALLEAMQAEFRQDDLDWARELAEVLLARFEDRAAGGFYFTSDDHERLIQRPKPGHDNATPSGNGVAAFALQRLGHLVGEPRYLEAAARAIGAFYPAMRRYPGGFATLLMALEEYLSPPRVLVLRGPEHELAAWRRSLDQAYRPDLVTLAIPAGAAGLPPALDKPVRPGQVNAWLCEGVTCSAPVASPAELERLLNQGRIE